MVSGTRFDGGGGTQILSARVRKTIQSIKEIVGNHSDADIYVTLKESDMDPNETTQKLLNQDPFHEVKRKRDKKKENSGYKASAEPRKQAEHTVQDTKSQPFPNRNSRRGGFTRNALPDAGTSREFRIVRDNRVNQNSNREFKPVSNQCSTSTSVQALPNVSEKSSRGVQTDPKGSSVRNSDSLKSSPAFYGLSDASSRHARDATSGRTPGKELHEETRASVLIPGSRVQGPKSHHSQPHSASLATTSSVVGVYSSSSDPVHVPSPDSRSSGTVGAIKREVGVVGVRRQSSENSPKNPSVPSSSFSTSFLGKDLSAPSESVQTSTAVAKNDQHGQATVPEPVISNVSVSKSFLNNQYSNKPYQQPVGHQKAPQANMEWKPKSSQKSSVVSPGIIGTAATSILPAINNSSDSTKEVDHLEEKLSRVNVFENQHVIIPQHLRVPESDRTHLIFGNFGAGFDSTESFASGSQALGNALHSNGDPSTSVSASSTSSEDNQVDLLDDPVRNSRSDSPASAATSEHLLPEQKESSSPGNLENYVDIGLVRNTSPAYTPAEPQQQQDPAGLSSFAAYDPQTGYDMPFFRPTMEESLRGQGLPSQQEALSSHAANSIPASTVAMMQQQPVAQLYPQVHLSHFPNFMPYRQILSPVYVPPMAVPGYSNNPSYPHPSNGSSYLLMPGSNSHLAAAGLKYGTSQYKPIPAGNPTGFGSYTNQTGYAINAQGAIGGSGLEDSTRMKYKEGNLYIPNPQAETSEIWIQTPRELPGMQSTQYYNLPTQQQHAAYLQSHTGHASFNAAAPQSSHMQFPGLYHPSQQPTSIANPHHMVSGMGGNVGVGVAAAAPGAQVGAYQQPQMGHHLNWTTNF